MSFKNEELECEGEFEIEIDEEERITQIDGTEGKFNRIVNKEMNDCFIFEKCYLKDQKERIETTILEFTTSENTEECPTSTQVGIYLHLKNWSVCAVKNDFETINEEFADYFPLEDDGSPRSSPSCETDGPIKWNCKACLGKFEGHDMYCCGECDKCFCRYCIISYMKFKLKQKKVLIPCLSNKCSKYIAYEYLTSMVDIFNNSVRMISENLASSTKISQQIFDLEETMQENLNQSFLSSRNLYLKPCPVCSDTYVLLNTNHENQNNKDLKSRTNGRQGMDFYCKRCNTNFCFFCENRAHCLVPCVLFDKFLELISLSDEITTSCSSSKTKSTKLNVKIMEKVMNNLSSIKWIEKNTKLCPICLFPIIKGEGCNHVYCTSCSTHFCYRCGKDFREKFDYKHVCDKDYFNIFKVDSSGDGMKTSFHTSKGNSSKELKICDSRKELYLTYFLKQYYEIDKLLKRFSHQQVKESKKKKKTKRKKKKKRSNEKNEIETIALNISLDFSTLEKMGRSSLVLKRSFSMIFHGRRVLMNSYILEYFRFDRELRNMYSSIFVKEDFGKLSQTEEEIENENVMYQDLYKRYQDEICGIIGTLDLNLMKMIEYHTHKTYLENLWNPKLFEEEEEETKQKTKNENRIKKKPSDAKILIAEKKLGILESRYRSIVQNQWKNIDELNHKIINFFKFLNGSIMDESCQLWTPSRKTYKSQIPPFFISLDQDLTKNEYIHGRKKQLLIEKEKERKRVRKREMELNKFVKQQQEDTRSKKHEYLLSNSMISDKDRMTDLQFMKYLRKQRKDYGRSELRKKNVSDTQKSRDFEEYEKKNFQKLVNREVSNSSKENSEDIVTANTKNENEKKDEDPKSKVENQILNLSEKSKNKKNRISEKIEEEDSEEDEFWNSSYEEEIKKDKASKNDKLQHSIPFPSLPNLAGYELGDDFRGDQIYDENFGGFEIEQGDDLSNINNGYGKDCLTEQEMNKFLEQQRLQSVWEEEQMLEKALKESLLLSEIKEKEKVDSKKKE